MQVSTSPASMPVCSMKPHGVEEVGEEQAVDDEAGQVGNLDRGLAERRAPGERLLAGRVGAVGEADLDQLHPRHRVEDVEAEEPAVDAAGLGDLGDAERGGRGRQVGVRAGLGDRRQQLALRRRPPRRSPRRSMSQSERSAGSVVTRSREGSAPSILAQAATTFSSARQAEASLRASRIVSPVDRRDRGEARGDRAAPGDPRCSRIPCPRSSGPGSYQRPVAGRRVRRPADLVD